jgi:hypothetical protein
MVLIGEAEERATFDAAHPRKQKLYTELQSRKPKDKQYLLTS